MRAVLRAVLLIGSLTLLGGGGIGAALHASGPEGVGKARALVEPWRERLGLPEGREPGGALEAVARLELAISLLGLGVGAGLLGRRLGSRDGRAPAPSGPERSAPASPPRGAARRIRKQASAIETGEGPEEAGLYLVAHGLPEEAIEIFKRHDLFERAAEALNDLNRFEECAELYKKAGRHEAAAAVYAQLGRFNEAAQCYQAARKHSLAAEMFEKAESFLKAARCYREIGFHRNAAEVFLKAGRESDAAESLIAVFNEEGAGHAAQSGQRQQELAAIAAKAAQLLAGLGRVEEAERLLVRAGQYEGAATMASAAGAFDRAAELYQRIGRADLAADALKKGGDEKGAARLRGWMLRDKGEDSTAAGLLERAEEYGEAADLYRKLERHERAAECYTKAGDHAAAAEMFRAAGTLDRASEAYERAGAFDAAAACAGEAGDRARSASLLEKAGKIVEAGRAYAEVGRVEDAIRVLQRVDPQDERFAEAAALLGRQFQAKGMLSLAVKKLEQAVGSASLSRQTISAHYDLARVLEDSGQLDRAIEEYERILAFDYGFEDVGARLEGARARRKSGTAPESKGQPSEKSSGRYRILRELGRGGMGVVYLARDAVLEREVAFKVLPQEIRESAAALRNFLREAKAAAKLNHPNIVTVYDAGESEHGFYLAMEYVEGSTLKTILERRGVIPPTGVVYVLRQMCDALAYAHKKKVIHRDIKTGNTMWTPARIVKIMDFGLAKLLEEVRSSTTLISGTPFYMSPEQVVGTEVDHRTDLYSLGAMMFELATGQVPFRSGNVPYHHVHTAPPNPRELNPKVPESLAGIILRCLEKEPGARYPSAEAILEDLERAQLSP
jgi:tetratricopeptide (TPR) repeat protein